MKPSQSVIVGPGLVGSAQFIVLTDLDGLKMPIEFISIFSDFFKGFRAIGISSRHDY